MFWEPGGATSESYGSEIDKMVDGPNGSSSQGESDVVKAAAVSFDEPELPVRSAYTCSSSNPGHVDMSETS